MQRKINNILKISEKLVLFIIFIYIKFKKNFPLKAKYIFIIIKNNVALCYF